MNSAIYFISTKEHLNKNIDQFVMLSNMQKNTTVFIVFLDEWQNVINKVNRLPNITFITPGDIGLKVLEVKQLAFAYPCSEFNAKMASLIHHFDKRDDLCNIYIGYKYQLTTHYLQFILSLADTLITNPSIQHAGINMFTEYDFTYLYAHYADNQLISKEDREKFINMHDIEKKILGDPFRAMNKIRNIQAIIGAIHPLQESYNLDSNTSHAKSFKSHKTQLDVIFANMRWYQLLIVVIVIILKVVKKFMLKISKILRITGNDK